MDPNHMPPLPVRTLQRLARLAPVLLLALALAPATSAAPITLFFDGPVVDGEHKGIADPTAAQAAGVPLLSPQVFQVDGVLAVIGQSADEREISDVDSPFTITSTWTVENQLATPMSGEVFLLFAEPENRTLQVQGVTRSTDYVDTEVGLTIDPLDGWVIVETEDPVLGTFYYVGISLGELLEDPGAIRQFELHYYLENPEAFQSGSDTIVALPQMNLLMAHVPEPSTGLLFGSGLAFLAARRRGRR